MISLKDDLFDGGGQEDRSGSSVDVVVIVGQGQVVEAKDVANLAGDWDRCLRQQVVERGLRQTEQVVDLNLELECRGSAKSAAIDNNLGGVNRLNLDGDIHLRNQSTKGKLGVQRVHRKGQV